MHLSECDPVTQGSPGLQGQLWTHDRLRSLSGRTALAGAHGVQVRSLPRSLEAGMETPAWCPGFSSCQTQAA